MQLFVPPAKLLRQELYWLSKLLRLPPQTFDRGTWYHLKSWNVKKVQGMVDGESEFASTPSGQYAYTKWLWKVPIVATANFTTRNLDLLRDNDFLSNPENRVLVEREAPPGQRS